MRVALFSSFISAASLAATLFSTAASAQPQPIVGGVTSVELTAAPTLTAAGLSVAPLGSATASVGAGGLPVVDFPITGGSIDPVSFAGGIEHEGSGLLLSSGSTTLSLENFFIDTVGLQLLGDVTFGTTALADVALFDIGLAGTQAFPFSLSLTAAAAGALTAVFGLPDLAGVQIGLAATSPVTAVPEPATYAVMLAGLALLALMVHRRRAAQQPPPAGLATAV